MSRLVTGNAKHLAPRPEIQPYTEGRSTFYTERETIKLGTCAPPRNPPFPVQATNCDSLLSRTSVTSQDVTMQQQVSRCFTRQWSSHVMYNMDHVHINARVVWLQVTACSHQESHDMHDVIAIHSLWAVHVCSYI